MCKTVTYEAKQLYHQYIMLNYLFFLKLNFKRPFCLKNLWKRNND